MKTVKQMETESILAMGEKIKHYEGEIDILRQMVAGYQQEYKVKIEQEKRLNVIVKDLAVYASHLAEDMSNNPDAPSYDEIFAELIINECCSSIMKKDRYRRDYFAAVIKNHFGLYDGEIE